MNDDGNILISRELKKAPMNKKLGLNSWCTIKKISGKIIHDMVQVQIMSGKGPNDQPPGSIIKLPAYIKVGVYGVLK